MAGVIPVLALVPGIDIDKFEPFGFKFEPGNNSEFVVWCLLVGVLGFYLIRFMIDAIGDCLNRPSGIQTAFRTRCRRLWRD